MRLFAFESLSQFGFLHYVSYYREHKIINVHCSLACCDSTMPLGCPCNIKKYKTLKTLTYKAFWKNCTYSTVRVILTNYNVMYSTFVFMFCLNVITCPLQVEQSWLRYLVAVLLSGHLSACRECSSGLGQNTNKLTWT